MNAVQLINKHGKTVTLIRSSSAGTISDGGRYTKGTETESEIKMFAYPASGRDLEVLPEGERTKEYLSGLCYDEVRMVSRSAKTQADKIETNGKTYQVMNVKFYEASRINIQPFYHILMTEVNA